MKKITILLFIFIQIVAKAESNYDAIVLLDSTSIIFETSSKIIESKKLSITINNNKGKAYSYLELQYNSYTTIKSLKGRILDKNKKLIKKISLKEIPNKKLYSDSFVDDERVLTYYPGITTYPCTVEWEYTLEYNPFLFSNWIPLYTANSFIKKSCLVVIEKNNNSFKFLEKNNLSPCNKSFDQAANINIWEINNIELPESLDFLPLPQKFLPYLEITPNSLFFLNNYLDFSSWETIGTYINSINKDKSIFNIETEIFFKNLVKDATSDEEKIKILYHYLQKNTRYVSIGIGSGGWVPLSAQYVHDNKYGDCKALSIYMTSMLKTVGIESFYTLVCAGENKNSTISPTFPTLHFNHVIVCVPNINDTIWLECTNPSAPFNFLGDFTSNRYALLIKPIKSELVKTQTYSLLENNKTITTKIYNWKENEVSLDVTVKLSGDKYMNFEEILEIDLNKQNEVIKNYLHFNNGEIKSFTTKNTESPYPISELQVIITVDLSKYRINNKLYFPCILFHNNKISNTFDERKFPFEKNLFYSEIDSITIEIPQNITLSNIPDNINKETEFGNYIIQSEFKKDKLIIIRKSNNNSFYSEANKYNEFINFIEFINTQDNKKIILN